MSIKIHKEIESFQKIWVGGFCRSKMGWEQSVLAEKNGNGRDIENIAKLLIKNYADSSKTCLEIGTDGGVWMTQMTDFGRLIGLDVRNEFKTNFWNNLENWLFSKDLFKKENVSFFVNDNQMSCKMLKDNSIDHVFSFDVFCHISYEATELYLKNLHKKLKQGANLFIMIADPEKYPADQRHRMMQARYRPDCPYNTWEDVAADFDGEPYPGRWYFYGIERFKIILEKYGYKVISEDVAKDLDPFCPIVHFVKV